MPGRIGNVVFDAPGPTLAAFGESAGGIADLYADLLGLRRRSRADLYRDAGWAPDAGDELDPIVDGGAGPAIAFECERHDYHPVRWPDPDHPAQVHLDVAVPDLDAAHERVVRHGATPLLAADDHRVYADRVGHPFCLYPEPAGPPEGPGRIARVVFDCADPSALGAFWTALLDLPAPLVATPERVETGPTAGGGPALAFQRVDHHPPRWPDPAHPQQLHLDVHLPEADLAAARARAERLGAARLPDLGGGVVYADPAGHPFCVGDA